MNWKTHLTKTPYFVLFVMLISVGMTGAYALSINLDGDVISYLGTLDMNNNKITNVGSPVTPSDVATKGYVDSVSTDTLSSLSCNFDELPKWNGIKWECGKL